jgi:hypothetical protein
MKRRYKCKSELREGDDHKMHRWCSKHRSWFWGEDRVCIYVKYLEI